MIRRLRKHYIAFLFLNKITKIQDKVLSSDDLQNLLMHSQAISLNVRICLKCADFLENV